MKSKRNKLPGEKHDAVIERRGLPDDYTLIPYRGKTAAKCPDSPRYKAIGNSMAVPVLRWIGERIAAIDRLSCAKVAQLGSAACPSV